MVYPPLGNMCYECRLTLSEIIQISFAFIFILYESWGVDGGKKAPAKRQNATVIRLDRLKVLQKGN